MDITKSFLTNTIGEKSIIYLDTKASPDKLTHYVLLYWLTNNVKTSFSGPIPGIDESTLVVSRNMNNKFDGYLRVKNDEFHFENDSILDVAAVIAICLNFDNNNFAFIDSKTTNLINSLILGHQKKFHSNSYSIKFSKLETTRKCEICQNHLFKNGEFVGCFCFSSEGVRSCVKKDYVMVEFDRSIWEKDDVTAILQMTKK
jgi:hypothetical protein